MVRLRAKRASTARPRTQRAGVDVHARNVGKATPLELIDLERRGVPGELIKQMASRIGIPSSRFFAILGLPKATGEKKAASGALVSGSSGCAAIGVLKLLAIAQAVVDDSTAPEAQRFDAGKWLGLWIERPQPALGGRKPADLIATPTGVEVVARLLGAIESGAFQ
jgi:putative toxin-antitoxin system antitoxin component (TIGR02293 family)